MNILQTTLNLHQSTLKISKKWLLDDGPLIYILKSLVQLNIYKNQHKIETFYTFSTWKTVPKTEDRDLHQVYAFFIGVCHPYSTIYKAASRHSFRLEPPPWAVPATISIHGLWEFQELYQAKSWNGQEL